MLSARLDDNAGECWPKAKNRAYQFVCVGDIVLAGYSAGWPVVTMEEAIRAALKINPGIGAIVENCCAANHELSQARPNALRER
jgi:hypothetical protein